MIVNECDRRKNNSDVIITKKKLSSNLKNRKINTKKDRITINQNVDSIIASDKKEKFEITLDKGIIDVYVRKNLLEILKQHSQNFLEDIKKIIKSQEAKNNLSSMISRKKN